MNDLEKQMDELLHKRQEADYMCYLFLENNINAIEALRIKNIAAQAFFDEEARDEFFEQLEDVTHARREANDKYMRAVAGR